MVTHSLGWESQTRAKGLPGAQELWERETLQEHRSDELGSLEGTEKLAKETAGIPQKGSSPLGPKPGARGRNWSEVMK